MERETKRGNPKHICQCGKPQLNRRPPPGPNLPVTALLFVIGCVGFVAVVFASLLLIDVYPLLIINSLETLQTTATDPSAGGLLLPL